MDAERGVETVISFVAVHPPFVLYVMVVVPAEIPVTTPELLTVATDVLEDIHGLEPAAVPEPVNVVVEPAHKVDEPVMLIVGFIVNVTGGFGDDGCVEVTIVAPVDCLYTLTLI